MKGWLKNIFLLLILISPEAWSQSRDFFFRHLSTADGLSNNSVYSICEDNTGFIWIGTRSGLNRFNGNTFRIYDNNNSRLRNSHITVLYKDSSGRIWAGTLDGGISIYREEEDDFNTYTFDPADSLSLSHDYVRCIAENKKREIWIGTHDGSLNIYHEAEQNFTRIPLSERISEYRVERINCLHFDSDTSLMVGTLNGLFRYDLLKGTLAPVLVNQKHINVRILCMFRENQGLLWLGTARGLIRLDIRNMEADTLSTANSELRSDFIQDIERLPDGRIMVGTDGGGLYVYNHVSGRFSVHQSDPNNPYSLSNNSVYDIFIDSYQNLWVGNYTGGLNYYSKYDWKFFPLRHIMNDDESLSDNHVRAFFQDRDGVIWIGTLGGLNRMDPLNGKFSSYRYSRSDHRSISSNSVICIYEDREGVLWIGTYGGGINLFDRKGGSFTSFSHPDDTNNSLEKANIYGIVETFNNKVCIASLGGIYMLDRSSGRMSRYVSGNSPLSNNTVKSICRDRNGIIWLGTNHGLNRMDPVTEEITVYLHSNIDQNSLTNNRILCIFEASDGKLWIGTEGGGINIHNPLTGRFTSISTRDGLPDNVINAILQDDQGLFWVSTNKGLACIEPKQNLVKTFTEADGLQSSEFYPNSALRDKEGKLYFGGINGFNAFYPRNISYNETPPRIILTDLYISNKPVRAGEPNSPLRTQIFLQNKLLLPSSQANFEIHFTGLGFINRGKYLYSHYLEGLDDEWTTYRDIRAVNYSNLRPGWYTFYVKAVNNDGVESVTPASIRIRVLPPWWKTWWALSLYGLTVVLLMLLFTMLNVQRIKVRHQLELERKERDQQEELNKLKMSFFTNISHEFKTPLTLIIGHLDNLKDAIKNIPPPEAVRNIETNARRLLFLINQLLEFRKAESGMMKLKASKGNILSFIYEVCDNFTEMARKKGISLNIIHPHKVSDIWFDAEKTEKILFNLLSNAIKFTGEGGEVNLEVRELTVPGDDKKNRHARALQIMVKDTGIGIPPDELELVFERFGKVTGRKKDNPKWESSGIGLAYTKRLVELHHGTISVSSIPGKGSVFTVTLPAGRSHLSEEEMLRHSVHELSLNYNDLIEELSLSAELFQQKENSLTDKAKPVILVVDDNPSVCSVIAGKFESSFSILTAANGQEGLGKARKSLPDIIISDIMMPVMDGIELCNTLKEDILTCHIPVILLTAKSGDENQLIGIRTGAEAYIAKPYNPDILVATVENLLQTRKLLRKKFVDQTTFEPSSVVNNKLDEQFLDQIIAIIEKDDFADTTDVPLLCREIGMSRSALYRKLKALTDYSIQDFIRTVKLRKSARLLHESGLTVSEIAYISGFTNTKHFSTSFRKQFGETPTEYRRNIPSPPGILEN